MSFPCDAGYRLLHDMWPQRCPAEGVITVHMLGDEQQPGMLLHLCEEHAGQVPTQHIPVDLN